MHALPLTGQHSLNPHKNRSVHTVGFGALTQPGWERITMVISPNNWGELCSVTELGECTQREERVAGFLSSPPGRLTGLHCRIPFVKLLACVFLFNKKLV